MPPTSDRFVAESGLTRSLQLETVRDSREFNKKLNNLILGIENDNEGNKTNSEKRLLGDLLKSKVFWLSSKPWEVVNLETFLKWQKGV